MTIPFFKKLYKAFSLGMCITTSLHALSPEQEVKACKSALLSQINEQKRVEAKGCPTAQNLVYWLGLLRKPEQFTPQELMGFLSTHSHWPQHKTLCKKSEETIAKDGSDKEILTWFGKYPPQTPVGAMGYAKALLTHNEKTKAGKVVVSAWRTMEFTKSEEKKFLASFSPFLQEKDYHARLQFLLWNESVDDAKRLLPHVSASARKVAEVRLGFLNEPSDALQKMGSLSAKSQQDPGLLYEKARWHKKQKEFQEAATILSKVPSALTTAEKWWKVRSYISREFIELRDYQTAYNVLRRHALQPGPECFADAEWLMGWLALRFLNKPKEARTHFETLYANVESAISKARGAYWVGRTHEVQKNIELAAKWYRKAAKYKTTYYGQLAAAKLQDTPYPSLASKLKATAEEKKRFEQNDLVKAAYILKKLGKDAATELSKFLAQIATQAKTKGERELAVHLAHTLSPYDLVWTAKKAGHKEPVLLTKAYPAYDIPRKGQSIPETAFIMAIAYKESMFNPTACSPANAMGLLQVLPKTAADMAKGLGISHKVHQLFDPHHNLILGSAFLAELLKDYDHSYVLTIAAYNAGPGRVKRWLEVFGDPRKGEVDILDWIELIPFAETRNHVMRVLENVTNYRCLKGPPKKTLIHDLQR